MKNMPFIVACRSQLYHMRSKIANQLLEKVKLDYDQIAEDFSSTRQHAWKEFELFQPYIKPNSHIADIGCGNGRLISELRNDENYTGVDVSEHLLDQARKNHPHHKFLTGSLLDIPLPDNSIDTTFSIAALHHIPSEKLRKKAVVELTRITKPGGYIIITVWNLWQKKYLPQILKAALKKALFGPYEINDLFIPWRDKVDRYYHAFFQKELFRLLAPHLNIITLKPTSTHNIIAICQKPA
jgi:tRNA (uracil-5-)-methyltransferase TRM9